MRNIVAFCLYGFALLGAHPAFAQQPDFNTLETIRIREAFQKAKSPDEVRAATKECFKVVQYFNAKERELYLRDLAKGIADNSTLTMNYNSKKLSDLDDRTVLAFNRICHP